jgi:hypothetical protein
MSVTIFTLAPTRPVLVISHVRVARLAAVVVYAAYRPGIEVPFVPVVVCLLGFGLAAEGGRGREKGTVAKTAQRERVTRVMSFILVVGWLVLEIVECGRCGDGGVWIWEVEVGVVLVFISVLSDAKITQM